MLRFLAVYRACGLSRFAPLNRHPRAGQLAPKIGDFSGRRGRKAKQSACDRNRLSLEVQLSSLPERAMSRFWSLILLPAVFCAFTIAQEPKDGKKDDSKDVKKEEKKEEKKDDKKEV